MLSCGNAEENELLSSSGVVVQDKDLNKYLTVATHGFPTNRREVYHPTGEGSIIGEVHSVLGDSDISLVRLRPGVLYAFETFGNEMKCATKLSALRRPAGLHMRDILTMENSFSGYCEGMFVETIWKALHVDENRQVLPCVILSSFFMGNGGEEPVGGSCGCPVVTEDAAVVGLFRFLASNGKAYCVSPEVLLMMGMKLDNVECRSTIGR
jgi:hypothetical protein